MAIREAKRERGFMTLMQPVAISFSFASRPQIVSCVVWHKNDPCGSTSRACGPQVRHRDDLLDQHAGAAATDASVLDRLLVIGAPRVRP